MALMTRSTVDFGSARMLDYICLIPALPRTRELPKSMYSMKAIHLIAYGDPTQDLRLVEVSEPDKPRTGGAGEECLCSSP